MSAYISSFCVKEFFIKIIIMNGPVFPDVVKQTWHCLTAIDSLFMLGRAGWNNLQKNALIANCLLLSLGTVWSFCSLICEWDMGFGEGILEEKWLGCVEVLFIEKINWNDLFWAFENGFKCSKAEFQIIHLDGNLKYSYNAIIMNEEPPSNRWTFIH